MNTILNMHERA